jgi:putative SOS response-associated peptidase YedK
MPSIFIIFSGLSHEDLFASVTTKEEDLAPIFIRQCQVLSQFYTTNWINRHVKVYYNGSIYGYKKPNTASLVQYLTFLDDSIHNENNVTKAQTLLDTQCFLTCSFLRLIRLPLLS